jgi:hypothetical protein
MLIIFATVVTLCSDVPHGGGKWFYRVLDGHKCWFQEQGIKRGREKPREELMWPKYNRDFDLRWQGEEDPKGWSHKE